MIFQSTEIYQLRETMKQIPAKWLENELIERNRLAPIIPHWAESILNAVADFYFLDLNEITSSKSNLSCYTWPKTVAVGLLREYFNNQSIQTIALILEITTPNAEKKLSNFKGKLSTDIQFKREIVELIKDIKKRNRK